MNQRKSPTSPRLDLEDVFYVAQREWSDEDLTYLISYLTPGELLNLREFLIRLSGQSLKTSFVATQTLKLPLCSGQTTNSPSTAKLDTQSGVEQTDLTLGLKYFRAVSSLRGIAACATAKSDHQYLADIARDCLKAIGEPR